MKQPLDAILAVGDRMLAALESGDVDAFSTAVHERDGLIRSLSDAPPGNGPDVQRAARALTEQHARLETAMNRLRTALGSELGAFARFRSARSAYRSRRPRAILNKSLHG